MDVRATGYITGARHASDVDDGIARLRKDVARLRRENRRFARDVEHLRAGARVVVDELDTTTLARALARLAAQLLNGDRAVVALIEDGTLAPRGHVLDGQALNTPGGDYDPARGIAPRVVLHRRPYVCDDAMADPEFGTSYALALRCRNALCVPILNHQTYVMGIIEVHNRRDGGIFSDNDVRAAETLALQASIGFARARLFDSMHEWTRSLEMLLAFNAAINQHLNPSLLIRQLVENAARFLKADGGMAGLAVPSAEIGETVMISEAYWSRGQWHERPRSWARQEGLPGLLLDSEFPYIANDYHEDRLADASLIADFDVRRALCVPIKDIEDRLLGFFEIHKGAGQSSFTWQDAAFLESLANTTAVAIQNAQLLKALEIRNRQVQALSAFHVNRLEDERRHIARELHDEAGQALIGIKLGLQVLARQLPAAMPEVRQELDHLREHVNRSTGQLKDLARRLRPPTLDQLGLDVAIRQLASDHHLRTGIVMHLDLAPPAVRLPQPAEIALYRIAQEALTNAAKHADAMQMWLTMRAGPHGIEFVIRDDGRGFDVNAPGAGLGLLGMKERADMLGAWFEVFSKANEGTTVTVVVPAP